MMNKITLHGFFSCALLLTDVGGAINQRPSNAATNVGGHTFFNCTSDVPVAVTWLYSIGCTGAIGSPLTVNNCDIHSNYTSNFKTEKPDGSTCNLVISSASLSLGGCYTCFAGVGTGNIYQGMLIIIDSSASITTNGTERVSGEDVVISSSVFYRGPSIPQQPIPLPPSFYWTLQSETNQNITSYPGETTDTSASSYIIVTAQPPEIPPYESHVFFNLPVHIPEGCASNAPTYTDDTVTPPYPVSYSPMNVTVLENPIPCYYEQGALTCSASGHPPPTYKWFDLASGNILSESNVVTIVRSGDYQCVASNAIRGVPYNASLIVNITDCKAPENVIITASSGPCASDAASCGELNSDTLTCKASGYPEPEYEWSFAGKTAAGPTIVAEENTDYKCTATNRYGDQQHSASATLTVFWLTIIKLICMNIGISDPVCISILTIVIFFGLNLLFFTIFILCYVYNENCRNALNNRFPWLKKMLPCMNDDGCKCSVWIFYFVLLSIFTAIVFFPTILIMANCCEKPKKKSSQGNMQLNDRSGRVAGNTQVNSRGTTPNQSPSRLSVTTNPPSSLPTTAHYPQDPPSRPYPHSSNQQLQPTYSEYSDPYPRNLRQTPSPALSAGGVVYAELGVDNKPMSRRPIQPIQGDGDAYAAIALA